MITQHCEVYGKDKRMSYIHDNVMTNNHGSFSYTSTGTEYHFKLETIK